MSKKAVSLEERIDRIRRAIYRANPERAYEYDANYYVEQVYEGYAIVREYDNDLYYRVNYTETSDGVTAQDRSAWQRVEREWAAKARQQARAEAQPDDTLIGTGSAVKALGDGRVGGYLVRFSTADDPDLTGDYFTAKTYFGPRDGDGVDTLVHHSLPIKGIPAELTDRILSPLKTKKDEIGIFAETLLNMADDYEAMLYELANAGKLGWSSGASGHTTRKNADGEITRWIISEGSLTPQPAEPRNRVVSLKSLLESNALQVELQAAGDAATATTIAPEIPTHPTQEDSSVNEEQIKQFIQDQIKAALATAAKDTSGPVDTESVIKSAVAEAMKAIETAPAIKTAGVVVPNVILSKDEDADATAVKSFNAYVRRGEIKADLNTGVDAQGGYLVPRQYSNEVIAPLTEASIIRAIGARRMEISGTNSYRMPRMAHSGRAVKTAEGIKSDQQEPTLDEIEFTPFKYTRISKATDEQLEDSRVDVVSIVLAPDASQAFAHGENEDFTNGDGVGDPEGIVTGAEVGVTAASATLITADEIMDLFYSLNRLYRGNAVWMLNDLTIKQVRKLKGSDGQYLWAPMRDGQPETLLGRPVFTNNFMAAPAAGARSVFFGDPRYYLIADFAGLELKRLNELFAREGKVGFQWRKRYDGRVLLPAALKVLQQAAA